MNSHSDISVKLGCVLLAAGGSSRLGQPKQLVPFQGQSLVEQRVEIIRQSGVDSIVVVTGREHDKILKILDKNEVTVVQNNRWEKGMGTSVALGVQQHPASLQGILVVLCDQWRLQSGDFRRLIRGFHSDISRISASKWENGGEICLGPPVIFPRWAFPELGGLKKGEKARQIIRNHQRHVTPIPMSRARWDLDSPEDLRELREFEKNMTLSVNR